MSTKTSIKRIALVAAAALTLGGFTAVSAHATYPTTTGATFGVTSAYAGQSTGATTTYPGTSVSTAATQTVGGLATVTFFETGTGASSGSEIWANITSTGVGVISSVGTGATTSAGATAAPTAQVQGSTGGTAVYPTTAISMVAAAGGTPASVTIALPIVVSSSAAGTQTLTATALNSDGSVVGSYTATITWGAATAAGISKANSILYTSSTSGCNAATSLGAAQIDAGTYGKSSAHYKAASAARICLATFDASGNAITPATSSVKFFGIGTVNGGATNSTANVSYGTLSGDSSNKGLQTLTAYATDAYGNTVSWTTTFTWYGNVASIVLANNVFADHASATSTGIAANAPVDGKGAATDTTGYHTLGVQLLDSAGAVIPQSAWGTVTNHVSATNLKIVSDKGNGNVSGAKGQSNAYATVTFDSTGNDYAGQGSKWGGFDVACSQGGKYEHLKITAYAYNSATGADDLVSNTVDFYCSGLVATVAVTAPASADAGTTNAVNVSVLDANGYPVGDGTAVSLASSNGGIFLGGSTTTTNGSLYTPTNLIAGSQGDNVVTALVSGATPITGTATVSVSGGVAGSSSLALDAANAATDAANNAYDEAQNATQAASDALAAVTALSAQVGALIATVKSLAAVVAKIKAKVKA